MSLYTIALFLHVSGAVGTFVCLGIWMFGLAALRRAQRVEQVRAIVWLIIVASPLMVFSVLLITSIIVMGITLVCGLLSSVPYWYVARRWSGRSSARVTLVYEDPFLKKTIWTRRW